MDQIKIGRFIAERRKQQGMTQMQLAEALGLTDRAVSKWENGISDPSTSNLLALAKLFKVSAEELLQNLD